MARLVNDLASDLITATGRDDIALELDLAPIPVRADRSTALALMFNETITNAVKHAFDGRAGRLAVRTEREGEHIVATIEDDGPGMAALDPKQRSFGSELIETLTKQLGAERTVSAASPSGTRVVFRLPADQIVAD